MNQLVKRGFKKLENRLGLEASEAGMTPRFACAASLRCVELNAAIESPHDIYRKMPPVRHMTGKDRRPDIQVVRR
jgi:hypothetical protein